MRKDICYFYPAPVQQSEAPQPAQPAVKKQFCMNCGQEIE